MRHTMSVCLLFCCATLLAEDAPKPITPAEAIKKVGEKVTVVLVVKSTGGRSNTYLNSEEDFNSPTNLEIYIGKDVKEKFKKVGIENPTEFYQKKTLQVTGRVILFEEKKPRIPIADPEQIKVIAETK